MGNKEVKAAIMLKGLTQKALASEMGISYKTFQAKINHRKRPNDSGNNCNSYTAYFKPAEKEWLATRLGISSDLIE